jgi:hypothetical protein
VESRNGTWGSALSPYQESEGANCRYKSHVVRRELVHGSYEEHIEGDKYTTIEGTWFSKIKGNMWDTFYGYIHQDFNEHFEEVFHSTKTEVQQGEIYEYNHRKSWEYYYDDVTNIYGGPFDGRDTTPTVRETFHGRSEARHLGEVEEWFEGTVTQWYDNNVTEQRHGLLNLEYVKGFMASLFIAGCFSTHEGVRIDMSGALDLDISVIKIGSGVVNMVKNGVEMHDSQVEANKKIGWFNTVSTAVFL